MPRSAHAIAPSRLHFGLWSLGDGDRRQFGGVGAMMDRPRVEIIIGEDQQLAAEGPSAERAIGFARRWAEFHAIPLPSCRIQVREAIPEHAGLGSGTQLALSVAAGLSAFCGLPSQSPQELALSVSRGLRSAVGTYGFVFGGLIVEQGKLPSEPISPLDCRIDLPDPWRFVLIRPRGLSGLAGDDEATAFGSLPAVPPTVTEQLVAIVRDRLVPAAAIGDFELFSESLYEYGRRSGECFAARQGGPFNGPLLTSLIKQIRGMGHLGVGQSSWGPTIFVAAPTQTAAEQLATNLHSLQTDSVLDALISPPNNRGALVEVIHQHEPAKCG